MTEQPIVNDELSDQYAEDVENDIAIIAMAGSFPDADNLETFWDNLKDGVESVKTVSNEKLREDGFGEFLKKNPNFIKTEANLDPQLVKLFDAAFFNMSPREAEIMDPQQRMFLEKCWELFERAGYSTEHYAGRVGVFGSTAASGYLESNLYPDRELLQEAGVFQISLGNSKDFLATRISYKMGFKGPSINVNTLCSSSAVGVHLARESLLNYQTDLALAGAVSLSVSTAGTTYYHEGGIGADDGHCRAYDERASGTVSGSGLGIIAMKRLSDALTDGDTIVAVLKATAVNNDGSNKASYTAPSPEGQAEVIAEAIAVSGVNPETIGYIDGHGTATNIGDPIEIAALTKAYRQHTNKKQFCGIGSVKTNIGHLVTAGGIASLIKTVLSLQHKQIPPSLNFERPNPKIDFANSPFYVNDKLREWQVDGQPRRAAVSSFGIGGTNVHMILEEAPERTETKRSNQPQLILLSAKTATALETMKANLDRYLAEHPNVNLADVAYTLNVGRCTFEYKFAALCSDLGELKKQLTEDAQTQVIRNRQKTIERSVCFMFSGQGSQYQQMAKNLYQSQPEFKRAMDDCVAIIQDKLQLNFLTLLYPEKIKEPCPLRNTQYAQLSLFVTEYALVQLWKSWGVKPDSMIGHSIGEYVAACVSGVFSLEDAISIVAERGRLMDMQAQGDMISVALSEQDVSQYLNPEVSLAAVNGPHATVLAGHAEAISRVTKQLEENGVGVVLLHTSHAFHSFMMDAVLPQFKKMMDKVVLNKPNIEFISNVTGDWITDEQAIDPAYWVEHLRSTVRFNLGIENLAEDESRVFVEIGPGSSLSTLSKLNLVSNNGANSKLVISSLPKFNQQGSEQVTILMALAKLWSLGVKPDWNAFHCNDKHQRIPLPTYPFERKQFWVEPKKSFEASSQADIELSNTDEIKQKCTGEDVFSTGNIQVDFDFSSESNDKQQDQILAVLELKKELERLCTEVSGSSRLNLKVSTVGLIRAMEHKGSPEFPAEQEPSQNQNSRPEIETDFVTPNTELEKSLASDWEKALGYNPVGINDNFFDVGGHSLVAATLVNQLRQAYDVNLDLKELLEVPTVAKLAELIETKQWLSDQAAEKMDTEEQETETLLL